MHLLYLYVKKYRALLDVGFNFESGYRFSYANATLELEQCDHQALPADFYRVEGDGKGRVDCISAIIGENGSGKTSVAVLLQDIMEPSGSMPEFVTVFGERNAKNEMEFSVYCHVSRDINTGKPLIKFKGFVTEPPVSVWPDYTHPQHHEEDLRNKLRIIYYSPLFTTERVFGFREKVAFADEPIDSKGYAGAIQDRRRYAIRDVSVTGGLQNLLDDNSFSPGSWSPRIYERKRIISFMSEIAQDEVLEAAFELPVLANDNALAVALLDGDLNETLHPVDIELGGKVFTVRRLESISGLDVDSFFSVQATACYLRSPVIRAFYLYAHACFLEHALSHPKNSALGKDVRWLIRKGNCVRRRIQKGMLGEREIENYVIGQFRAYNGGDTQFNSFGEFLALLQEFASHVQMDQARQSWFVPLKDRKEKSYELYIKMMEAYFEARRRNDICSFGFKKQLSSGEMIYVSMWARLYRAFADMRNGKGGHHSAILFMDEAETAMHPRWQRKLVYRTLKVWQRMMPEGKHLQVIFGSHSPMLLSDIPKDNVVFLGEKEEVEQMRSIYDTFGANIFDLFRLPFFLKQGPVGEFASAKINALLAGLAKGGNTLPRGSDNAKLAQLVGDPFIGKYLRSCVS